MTLIIYRDGVMAADTAVWQDHVVSEFTDDKIVRTKSGFLVGAAGQRSSAVAFRDWMTKKSNSKRPELDPDFAGLIVSPAGEIRRFDDKYRSHPITAPFAALGCATEFAIGALLAGMSARAVVALGIERCAFVGGSVVSLTLTR